MQKYTLIKLKFMQIKIIANLTKTNWNVEYVQSLKPKKNKKIPGCKI